MKTLDCHNAYRAWRGAFPGERYKRKRVTVHCNGNMAQTDWISDDGQDPELRQYVCGSCGHIEYLVDDNSYLRKVGLRDGR